MHNPRKEAVWTRPGHRGPVKSRKTTTPHAIVGSRHVLKALLVEQRLCASNDYTLETHKMFSKSNLRLCWHQSYPL